MNIKPLNGNLLEYRNASTRLNDDTADSETGNLHHRDWTWTSENPPRHDGEQWSNWHGGIDGHVHWHRQQSWENWESHWRHHDNWQAGDGGHSNRQADAPALSIRQQRQEYLRNDAWATYDAGGAQVAAQADAPPLSENRRDNADDSAEMSPPNPSAYPAPSMETTLRMPPRSEVVTEADAPSLSQNVQMPSQQPREQIMDAPAEVAPSHLSGAPAQSSNQALASVPVTPTLEVVALTPETTGLQCPQCLRILCAPESLAFFRRMNPADREEVHMMLKPELPIPETFLVTPQAAPKKFMNEQ